MTTELPPHRRRDPALTQQGRIRFFLSIVGTMILVAVIGTLLSAVPVRTVSYTEFKQMVRGGEVAAVVVSEVRIRGTLKKANLDCRRSRRRSRAHRGVGAARSHGDG
jgi:hypothetical protein